MEIESLAAALAREHRDIDEGIEAFAAAPASKDRDREPLMRAIRALRRHIYLEEEFLFPALHRAGNTGPVLVMLREHAQIWATLDALERDVQADPASATATGLCRELNVQLLHHNLKEEKILYPQADQVLPAPVNQRLRAFLDHGELPDGWTCTSMKSQPA